MLRRSLAVLTALTIALLMPAFASATATVTYVSGATGLDAGAASDGNDCSVELTPCATLTGALAQTQPGGTVEISGTLTEFSETDVSQDVTIEANPEDPGAGSTITSDSGNSDGLLWITTAVQVSIQGVTFTGFSGSFESAVTLLDDGATLDVTDSTFTDDTSLEGGAIDNATGDSVTISDSSFEDDSASYGGAIYNDWTGALNISDSTFEDDTATSNGGAIDEGDFGHPHTTQLTITDSNFIDNSAQHDGGAIDAGDDQGNGSVYVSGSTFEGNSSPNDGGAIDTAGGTGTGTTVVQTSSFDDNSAWDGGAIDIFDDGSGGGVVTTSSFRGNTASNNGPTIDSADHAGNGTLELAADVFDGSCDQPGGGQWSDYGDNVSTSISCLGTPTDGQPEPAVSSAVGDLGQLADNGGATQTLQLLDGNPAINLIPADTSFEIPVAGYESGYVTVSCATTDQRGVTNPGSTGCDAGAVQDATQTVSLTGSTPSSVVVGQNALTLGSTSSSGLTPSISVDATTTGSACSASGDIVSFNHTGSCVVEATAGNQNFSSAQAQRTITVDAAQTSTSLSAAASTLSASVAVVSPGGGTPTGTVDFTTGSQTLGTAQLVNGRATLSYSPPSNTNQNVTATYQGDDDYEGSGGSTTDAGSPATNAGTSTTGAGSTPTGAGGSTTDVGSPRPPVITAKLTSLKHRTANGWWTRAVRITFTCTARGSKLTSACPGPVDLDRSGRDLMVTRTIRARDGLKHTVTIHGIDIDLSRPKVDIKKLHADASYLISAPAPTCAAVDHTSGVRSCSLAHEVTSSAVGETITYTATSRSYAGTVARARLRVHVRTMGFIGLTLHHGDYDVTPGSSYTLEVLSRRRPEYLDAAVFPLPPGPAHQYFVADGEVNGITLWKLRVLIEPALAFAPRWTIGVRLGAATEVLRLAT